MQVAGDISNVREKRINTMFQMNLTIQPYIIVVGPTLTEISPFFVSVDKVLYNVSSAFEAIDVCFKTFHVMNATYPSASDHIWLLIQRELYKFTTPYDKVSSYVLEILNTLKNKSVPDN